MSYPAFRGKYMLALTPDNKPVMAYQETAVADAGVKVAELFEDGGYAPTLVAYLAGGQDLVGFAIDGAGTRHVLVSYVSLVRYFKSASDGGYVLDATFSNVATGNAAMSVASDGTVHIFYGGVGPPLDGGSTPEYLLLHQARGPSDAVFDGGVAERLGSGTGACNPLNLKPGIRSGAPVIAYNCTADLSAWFTELSGGAWALPETVRTPGAQKGVLGLSMRNTTPAVMLQVNDAGIVSVTERTAGTWQDAVQVPFSGQTTWSNLKHDAQLRTWFTGHSGLGPTLTMRIFRHTSALESALVADGARAVDSFATPSMAIDAKDRPHLIYRVETLPSGDPWAFEYVTWR